ncbi:alpha/beta fold hydrolase [Robertmurraya korlensis]|uniref:alpha/beta fold hydrolase n=1 Tax=Robertmurraya korlensis TaxID=519977 RepID=UPI000824D228|nr:alpha/beta hydrolase [Robertmurraya korlensis]
MQSMTLKGELICYDDIGEGLPIIFLHPPGMGRKVFDRQKMLSKHFRILLPDLAGHGDSSYNVTREVTVERYGEDIIEFMNQLEITAAVLFGYSSGGAIAQYLAIHHPSRVHTLILSGGYPIVDHWTIKNEHRLGVFFASKSKKLMSAGLAFAHTKDPELRRLLKEHMLKSNPLVWSKYYYDVMHFNCKDGLAKITAPVLLMYGSKSDVFNTYIKTYKKELADVEIFIIKGESHQLPTRQPSYVNQIITGYLLNKQ